MLNINLGWIEKKEEMDEKEDDKGSWKMAQEFACLILRILDLSKLKVVSKYYSNYITLSF